MSLKAPARRVIPRPVRVAPTTPVTPTRAARRRSSELRRATLLALVLVALSLRIGFLMADPYPSELSELARSNGSVAHNLLHHGRWFAVDSNTPEREARRLVDPADLALTQTDRASELVPYRSRMPGPALLLAMFWKLTGHERYVYLQVAQVLADSATVLLVEWTALRLFGQRRAALLAATGYALFVPIAAMTRIPFSDPWATDAAVVIFALFLRARDAARPVPWLLATGSAVGAAMWFRPALILLPVGLALALAGSIGWRRAALRGGLPVAVALVLVAPYSLWTLSDQREFTPVNVGFGQALWQGLGQLPNDLGAVDDNNATFEMVRRERPDLGYAWPGYDAYLGRKALDGIAREPGFYAALVASRLAWSVSPGSQSGMAARIELARQHTSPLAIIVEQPRLAVRAAAGLVVGPALLLLALAGLVVTWRRYRRACALLLASAVAVFAAPVLLRAAWRDVAPATFVYLIFAGLALDRALGVRMWRPYKPGVRRRRLKPRVLLADTQALQFREACSTAFVPSRDTGPVGVEESSG